MKMHGSNKYSIEYVEEVVKKDIPNLPKSHRLPIKKDIEERLTLDPIGFGKPLRYSLRGHRRLRIGDYRVVYRIHLSTPTVIILAIKHRKDICDDL